VKVILQEQVVDPKVSEWRRSIAVARQIAMHEGFFGFYRAFPVVCVQIGCSHAIIRVLQSF
jgi:hypothetical protein